MRVVHVLSGLDRRLGGVVAAVIGLAIAQAKVGLQVTVLSSFQKHEDNSAADELRAAGVKVTLVGPVFQPLVHYHRGNRHAAELAVAEHDIAHVHALWEDIQHQVMAAARRQRKPAVISPHGMLAGWSLRQKSWKKRLYLAWRLRRDLDEASAIHFTTEQEAREVAALGLRAPPLVETLGLDLTEFATLPPAGAFRDRYPQLAGRPIVLFLSRLHVKKGLDLLIPAFARANLGDARLVLAGPDEGGYEATVRALVQQHGLADRVVFTGMLRGADRIAAMHDADLFALTSYQENFGIVVLESLAAGTPVVISDQVQFAEHIAGQGVGEIVPCDVQAIAAALTKWVNDPTLRAAASAKARPFALERFDWLSIAERWKTHYARLTSKAGLVPSPGMAGRGLG